MYIYIVFIRHYQTLIFCQKTLFMKFLILFHFTINEVTSEISNRRKLANLKRRRILYLTSSHVWPVNKGCLLLLDTWFRLCCVFRCLSLSCSQFCIFDRIHEIDHCFVVLIFLIGIDNSQVHESTNGWERNEMEHLHVHVCIRFT